MLWPCFVVVFIVVAAAVLLLICCCFVDDALMVFHCFCCGRSCRVDVVVLMLLC